MKYSLLLVALLSVACSAEDGVKPQEAKIYPQASNITVVCPSGSCQKPMPVEKSPTANAATETVRETPKKAATEDDILLSEDKTLRISVTGQGVAPMNTTSPAQAYALAKRAATADAYRLIAEKVKGVRIDGDDLIKNMMVQRSTVRTTVKAMVRNANVVETTFKDGLCEVEMEITLSRSQFAQ